MLFFNLDFRKFPCKYLKLTDSTTFHAKTILISDVNLDKSDLSSTVRVQVFNSRYFSRIYFTTVAE